MKTYEQFMRQVDRILVTTIGCESNFLEDYLWRQHYEDECTPKETVEDFFEYYSWEYPGVEIL